MGATASCHGQAHLNLGPAERIPLGEGKVYDAAGVPVAVFRTREGRIFATEAACPHRGGPLADGLVGGSVVVCPLHAHKFDLSSGQPVENGCRALATHAVTLTEGGEMLLSLDHG